jgi:glycosyltransferase involved in cell wall biosynthesis
VRIGIVTESFPPEVNGVAHSVLRVAEHLVARGHQPLVIAPQPAAGFPPDTAPGWPADTQHGFPVVRVRSVPFPGYRSVRLGLASPAIQRALAGHRTDLVHLASPFFLGALGSRSARRLRLPVVAVYQTDVPGYARAYHWGRVAEAAAWRWLRGIHNAADRTLAPSTPSIERLARLFASLDVFVHSGCHETFGQTIQEAAASGLPVVAPAVGGPADLVEDGVTGCLVPPGDAGALTAATRRLAADPLGRAAMGRAGRQRVLARSWTALGDQLIRHYAAVLGERSGAWSAGELAGDERDAVTPRDLLAGGQVGRARLGVVDLR